MGGGVALPTLPVKKEVAPSGGDDTAAIQAAIGEISALPLVNGFRGVVLLKPGKFHCSRRSRSRRTASFCADPDRARRGR